MATEVTRSVSPSRSREYGVEGSLIPRVLIVGDPAELAQLDGSRVVLGKVSLNSEPPTPPKLRLMVVLGHVAPSYE